MDIVKVGNPVLRRPARPVRPEEIPTGAIQRLIDDLFDTVEGIGVGLAAPQVGVDLQIAVIEDSAVYQRSVPEEVLEAREREPVEPYVLINPTLRLVGEETVEFFEGCLSVPGYQAVVTRARRVELSALDRQGRQFHLAAKGWHARILQHEIDHLHGRLYVDCMQSWSFVHEEHYVQDWRFRPIADVRAALSAG